MEYEVINENVSIEDLKTYNYDNIGFAVLVHIEDEFGNILLQQRGSKARDDDKMYTEVGGGYEDFDNSFDEAIKREMAEEMGTKVVLEDLHPIGINHLFKNNINWIFVVYFAKYKGGNIQIMEKDKCLGYKFFTYEELMESDEVTKFCKFRSMHIKKQLNNKVLIKK